MVLDCKLSIIFALLVNIETCHAYASCVNRLARWVVISLLAAGTVL